MVLIATNTMCLAQTDCELSDGPRLRRQLRRLLMPVRLLIWKTRLEGIQNKQLRSFQGLLYKTYYGVYADGIKTLDMEVANMDKTDIDSYSLADIKVEFPNPSIAVITYKTSQRGTFDGKDVSGNYYNESVWVKKGDRWLNTFHTAIKAK